MKIENRFFEMKQTDAGVVITRKLDMSTSMLSHEEFTLFLRFLGPLTETVAVADQDRDPVVEEVRRARRGGAGERNSHRLHSRPGS